MVSRQEKLYDFPEKENYKKRAYMNSQSNVLLSDGSEHLPGVDDALVLDAQTAHQHVGKVHEWIALWQLLRRQNRHSGAFLPKIQILFIHSN